MSSNSEIYSFVAKVAFDVIGAELLAIGIPILGLIKDNVKNTSVDDQPNKNSETSKDNFVFI